MEAELLKLGGIAGALGAIIGLLAKLKNIMKERQQAKQAFEKNITAKLDEMSKKQDGLHNEIQSVRNDMMGEIQEVKSEISILQKDELLRGYHSYMKQGYCSIDDKQRILDMYDSYHSNGHNSLVDNLAEDIKNLPIFPPDEKDVAV